MEELELENLKEIKAKQDENAEAQRWAIDQQKLLDEEE